MQEKSQQLSMFASEGVNVQQQLLSLFAFGGGLEKVENALPGLKHETLTPMSSTPVTMKNCLS